MLRLHQARYSCHQHNSSERWQPRTGHIPDWKTSEWTGTPPSHQIIQRNGKKKRNPLMHSTGYSWMVWRGFCSWPTPPPPPTPTPTHPQHPLPTKLSMQEEDKSTYASWKMWKGFRLWPIPEPPTPFTPNYPMKQQEEKSTYWLTHSTVEWCGEVFVHDQPHPPLTPTTPFPQNYPFKKKRNPLTDLCIIAQLNGVEGFLFMTNPTPPPLPPTHPHHPLPTKLSIQEKSTYA